MHLGVQQVKPAVGNGGDGCVGGHQAVPGQELRKHLPLERLDELQLPAPLQLKALQPHRCSISQARVGEPREDTTGLPWESISVQADCAHIKTGLNGTNSMTHLQLRQ